MKTLYYKLFCEENFPFMKYFVSADIFYEGAPRDSLPAGLFPQLKSSHSLIPTLN